MKTFNKSNHFVIFKNDFCDWNTGELLSPIQTQNYAVIQVAELYYNNAFGYPNHLQHCDLEVSFPTTNGLFCATDGKREKLQKYEIYLSFKGEHHEVYSRSGCRFQTLAVNCKTPESKALLADLRQRFLSNRKRYSPELTTFFTAVVAEFLSEEQPLFLQKLDSLITLIFVNIARTQTSSDVEFSLKTTPSDILRYIDEHFLELYSLDELSVRFGYTYGHLCKIFKKEYLMTPVSYLISKKMDYALLLLSQGKTLTEIAEITGYSTSYNLSRAFKKYFGSPPAVFKQNNHLQ